MPIDPSLFLVPPIADVIFFIYLYQRWIYPIDPKRPNEYGVSQEMIEKFEAEKAADVPTGGDVAGSIEAAPVEHEEDHEEQEEEHEEDEEEEPLDDGAEDNNNADTKKTQ